MSAEKDAKFLQYVDRVSTREIAAAVRSQLADPRNDTQDRFAILHKVRAEDPAHKADMKLAGDLGRQRILTTFIRPGSHVTDPDAERVTSLDRSVA